MDLREVVDKVQTTAKSAYSSFHAGRPADAEKYLYTLEKLVVEYSSMQATPAGDVNGSATSEKPAEPLVETQAKVSGPDVHPAVIDPDAAAQQVVDYMKDEKPPQ